MSSTSTAPRDNGPAQEKDFGVARRVLKLESDAIVALADGLGDDFIAALDILFAVKGRVIVTGMGKSGHVARKIAATLASTGTPAYYVHPGEASHGDLGMVARDDAVVALSNSGNTRELKDLLEYTRRFSIPLIAISAKEHSILSEIADVALILPPIPEGCPIDLAPTTSTTASLALGDALAMALLERRGFTQSDFRVFHPGGQLGSSLLRIADLMHEGAELPLAAGDTKMDEVVLKMTEKRFGCVGIVDDAGCLIGIITDGDLRRHMGDTLFNYTANEIMTTDPQTIRRQALAVEALAVMNNPDRPITSLFVVENSKPIGIIHIHDCLRAGVR